MNYSDCNLSQPPNKNQSLHLLCCSKHDMETCLACKELLQKEEYEKLARIKKLVNINIDKEKSKRLKRHLRDLDYIFLNTTF